jgi:hypothetical protein
MKIIKKVDLQPGEHHNFDYPITFGTLLDKYEPHRYVCIRFPFIKRKNQQYNDFYTFLPKTGTLYWHIKLTLRASMTSRWLPLDKPNTIRGNDE